MERIPYGVASPHNPVHHPGDTLHSSFARPSLLVGRYDSSFGESVRPFSHCRPYYIFSSYEQFRRQNNAFYALPCSRRSAPI